MSRASYEVSLDVVLCGRVARNDHGQLEWQVAHLRECAAASGCPHVTVLTDVGGTGPGQELLDRLCAADAVVGWDASRLSRRPEHFLTVYRRLAAAGVEVVLAHRPSGAVEHSWSGRATTVALIRLAIEQEQRARHAERTRRGIAAARARRAGQQ